MGVRHRRPRQERRERRHTGGCPRQRRHRRLLAGLDAHGNSVRGIGVCQEISERLGLHVFATEAEDALRPYGVSLGACLVRVRVRAWINPYREDAGAIGRAIESVERLAGRRLFCRSRVSAVEWRDERVCAATLQTVSLSPARAPDRKPGT